MLAFLKHLSDAPVVTADSEGSVRSPLGRTLQLTCSLLGVPPPDTVTWTHNDTTLNDADPDITISSTSFTTTLCRANLLTSGGGPYVCTASNEVGSDNAHAIVRVQRKSCTALYIFIACSI